MGIRAEGLVVLQSSANHTPADPFQNVLENVRKRSPQGQQLRPHVQTLTFKKFWAYRTT